MKKLAGVFQALKRKTFDSIRLSLKILGPQEAGNAANNYEAQ
jgi:hypothetical protein